jgi:hypothetical protein
MMEERMRVLLISAALMLTIYPAFADLRDAEVVAKIQSWTVLRTRDSMTDKVSCVAVYKDEYRIQLSAQALYIGRQGRGGVKGYQTRLGSAAPGPYKLPTRIEEQMSTIILENVDEILSSKRLRISGLSYLQDAIDEDIDLGGAPDTRAILLSGKCSSDSPWTTEVTRP